MVTGLENFKIYLLAEELELEIHQIIGNFPNDEKYRSVDQLRRSSSSVTNNIAEMYNRYSYKEKIRGCYIAKGEAEETKRNIIRCGKKGLISKELSISLADRYTLLLKLISGYINFLRTKK